MIHLFDNILSWNMEIKINLNKRSKTNSKFQSSLLLKELKGLKSNFKTKGMLYLLQFTYSTSSVSSTATDYQHSRRAVLAWAVGPCGLVLQGLKDSTRRYANYAVDF